MGLNMASAFPSKYLKAHDVGEKGTRVRIRHIQFEQVGQDLNEPEKPVIYFENEQRGFVLNVTNNNTIMDMYGHDSDDWIGKEIILFQTYVDFGGKMVAAIRVRPGLPSSQTPQQQGNAAQAPAQNSENPNPDNLASPFAGDPLLDA